MVDMDQFVISNFQYIEQATLQMAKNQLIQPLFCYKSIGMNVKKVNFFLVECYLIA
jgi:hypothetical protein